MQITREHGQTIFVTEGSPVTWGEHVTDEEYRGAT
jgi:hypothetical protein